MNRFPPETRLHPCKNVAEPVNTKFAFVPRTMVVVMGVPSSESGIKIVPLPLMAAFAAFTIAPASGAWKADAVAYWAAGAANIAPPDKKHSNIRPRYLNFGSPFFQLQFSKA